MTGDDYITITKRILPVREGRYNELIQDIFKELVKADCFKKTNTKIDLKIISSAAMFSEVVDTKPAITVIWDNYQWEILEKFLLSALLYVNKHKNLAIITYKMNIYAALSIRVTRAAPELSYIFAKKYYELKQSNYSNIIIAPTTENDAYTDMLYCELLALGHEFSHILFERTEIGTTIYNLFEKDFLCIMDGVIKSKLSHKFNDEVDLQNLICDIKLECNREYRKELICDIYSYEFLGDLIEKMDCRICPNRKVGELFDDIIRMNEFVIRMMDSFSYWLEFWMHFGNLVTTNRFIKPENLRVHCPNFNIWKNQYYSRENLVSLYKIITLFRDRQIYVDSANVKYCALYNANCEIAQKLLSFEDDELIEIIMELQRLMQQNISYNELINNRDSLLEI